MVCAMMFSVVSIPFASFTSAQETSDWDVLQDMFDDMINQIESDQSTTTQWDTTNQEDTTSSQDQNNEASIELLNWTLQINQQTITPHDQWTYYKLQVESRIQWNQIIQWDNYVFTTSVWSSWACISNFHTLENILTNWWTVEYSNDNRMTRSSLPFTDITSILANIFDPTIPSCTQVTDIRVILPQNYDGTAVRIKRDVIYEKSYTPVSIESLCVQSIFSSDSLQYNELETCSDPFTIAALPVPTLTIDAISYNHGYIWLWTNIRAKIDTNTSFNGSNLDDSDTYVITMKVWTWASCIQGLNYTIPNSPWHALLEISTNNRQTRTSWDISPYVCTPDITDIRLILPNLYTWWSVNIQWSSYYNDLDTSYMLSPYCVDATFSSNIIWYEEYSNCSPAYASMIPTPTPPTTLPSTYTISMWWIYGSSISSTSTFSTTLSSTALQSNTQPTQAEIVEYFDQKSSLRNKKSPSLSFPIYLKLWNSWNKQLQSFIDSFDFASETGKVRLFYILKKIDQLKLTSTNSDFLQVLQYVEDKLLNTYKNQINNTPCITTTRQARWDKYMSSIWLEIPSSLNNIQKYRIQWFNGTWSKYYYPWNNDIDRKVNNSCENPVDWICQRRVRSYFDDHTHEVVSCGN
jgi:hypothetical protein